MFVTSCVVLLGRVHSPALQKPVYGQEVIYLLIEHLPAYYSVYPCLPQHSSLLWEDYRVYEHVHNLGGALFLFFFKRRRPHITDMCVKNVAFLCRTGLSGAIVPADSAQETINSIQTKLDHLYNRTEVNRVKVKAKEMPKRYL